MTSKEMIKARLPEGHIFLNVAKLGSKPNWKVVQKPDDWGHKPAPGRAAALVR